MAWPCYVYLKLKMSGPKRIITVSGSFKRAHECNVAGIKLTKSQIATAELDNLKQIVDSNEAP